jgi:steroid 5-alpha reductase family enzyme
VTAPTYILLLASRLYPAMTTVEYVFARFLIVLIVVEWFADGQQWNFHAAKAAYQRTAKPQPGYSRGQLDRGFNTTGLWKFSRHPNFAAEQTIWVTLYVWAAYTTGSWWNWTVAGPIAYLSVFAGSIPLTEYISAGKYPEYKLYQQRVGRCLPSIFGKYWKEDGELSLKDKVDAEAAKRANKRD